MRLIALLLVLGIGLMASSACWGIEDYNDRFVKNYPPGFNSMWYKAQRFYKNLDPESRGIEKYRWDKYMSRITNTFYPFFPIPYDWEYGSDRTFNLPNYNANNWR